jgi:hypothetical protein
MNKSKQPSYITLILTILIAYPGIVKSFHTHHDPITNGSYSCATEYHPQEKPCPVCDFEFVSFISEPPVHIDYFPYSFSIVNLEKTEEAFLEFPDYFSLRAPPATT